MIAILPNTSESLIRAQTLSQDLGLPLFRSAQESPVVLVVDQDQAWLRRLTPPTLDWKIDFTSPEYVQNFAGRTRHNDPLSRAIGLHKDPGLRVLDLTGGLGKDALWLSHCGAQVTLIERDSALAYLLSEAVKKSDSNIQVIHAEAKHFLSQIHPGDFEVAYYDPMFEPRNKSALVKKDMQILQALHGIESPDPSLVSLAKTLIPKVVVKRAKADPVLCEGVHHQLETKVTRFDVY